MDSLVCSADCLMMLMNYVSWFLSLKPGTIMATMLTKALSHVQPNHNRYSQSRLAAGRPSASKNWDDLKLDTVKLGMRVSDGGCQGIYTSYQVFYVSFCMNNSCTCSRVRQNASYRTQRTSDFNELVLAWRCILDVYIFINVWQKYGLER